MFYDYPTLFLVGEVCSTYPGIRTLDKTMVEIRFLCLRLEFLSFLCLGDEVLRASIFDAEQPNIDGVHEAIDKYRAAYASLNDGGCVEYTLEAEAFSKMGQIYFNVLKNEGQAKTHCLTAIQLANTVEHKNFAGIGKSCEFRPFREFHKCLYKRLVFSEWFDKATAIVKQIQDAARRKEEEEVRKNREPYLKVWKCHLGSFLHIVILLFLSETGKRVGRLEDVR